MNSSGQRRLDIPRFILILAGVIALGVAPSSPRGQREHMSQNRLAILPNLTHYEIFLSPTLAHTAFPFLNGETDAESWNEQVSRKK